MGHIKSLEIGEQYGLWTVLAFSHTSKAKHKSAYWLCRCICGREKAVNGHLLRAGKSKRCQSCSGKTNGKKGHRTRRDLYVVQCGPYIKIGSTDNIDIRLVSLQSGNPYPLELVLYKKNEGYKEKWLHKRNKPAHHRGEWYVAGQCELV